MKKFGTTAALASLNPPRPDLLGGGDAAVAFALPIGCSTRSPAAMAFACKVLLAVLAFAAVVGGALLVVVMGSWAAPIAEGIPPAGCHLLALAGCGSGGRVGWLTPRCRPPLPLGATNPRENNLQRPPFTVRTLSLPPPDANAAAHGQATAYGAATAAAGTATAPGGVWAMWSSPTYTEPCRVSWQKHQLEFLAGRPPHPPN